MFKNLQRHIYKEQNNTRRKFADACRPAIEIYRGILLQGFAPLAPTQIRCNMPILVAIGAIAIKKFCKMSLRKAW
jgi:hypothetical protein